MTIEKIDDLLAAIEQARTEKGMSERELSSLVGKSPSNYWWWKRRGETTSFSKALAYCKAVGLSINISAT